MTILSLRERDRERERDVAELCYCTTMVMVNFDL